MQLQPWVSPPHNMVDILSLSCALAFALTALPLAPPIEGDTTEVISSCLLAIALIPVVSLVAVGAYFGYGRVTSLFEARQPPRARSTGTSYREVAMRVSASPLPGPSAPPSEFLSSLSTPSLGGLTPSSAGVGSSLRLSVPRTNDLDRADPSLSDAMIEVGYNTRRVVARLHPKSAADHARFFHALNFYDRMTVLRFNELIIAEFTGACKTRIVYDGGDFVPTKGVVITNVRDASSGKMMPRTFRTEEEADAAIREHPTSTLQMLAGGGSPGSGPSPPAAPRTSQLQLSAKEHIMRV